MPRVALPCATSVAPTTPTPLPPAAPTAVGVKSERPDAARASSVCVLRKRREELARTSWAGRGGRRSASRVAVARDMCAAALRGEYCARGDTGGRLLAAAAPPPLESAAALLAALPVRRLRTAAAAAHTEAPAHAAMATPMPRVAPNDGIQGGRGDGDGEGDAEGDGDCVGDTERDGDGVGDAEGDTVGSSKLNACDSVLLPATLRISGAGSMPALTAMAVTAGVSAVCSASGEARRVRILASTSGASAASGTKTTPKTSAVVALETVPFRASCRARWLCCESAARHAALQATLLPPSSSSLPAPPSPGSENLNSVPSS